MLQTIVSLLNILLCILGILYLVHLISAWALRPQRGAICYVIPAQEEQENLEQLVLCCKQNRRSLGHEEFPILLVGEDQGEQALMGQILQEEHVQVHYCTWADLPKAVEDLRLQSQ